MASALKKLLWTLKLPYLPEAIRAVIKGPYTVDFPFGETFETGCYRGAPVWDEDICVGCGACAEVCPAGAITMVDDTESYPPMRRFALRYDRCIFCGHCHYNCTTDDGICQSPEWDLATFDRTQATTEVAKELLLCEACGCAVAPIAHVQWVARKVGPKAFANPTLALTLEGRFVRIPPGEALPGARADRSDIMRVVCPHCRRIVVLSESL